MKGQAGAPGVVATGSALDRYPTELFQALLIRRVEERLLKLFSEGKLFGTVHTCIGQEFSPVAVMRCLRPEDTVFSNHRGHGHYLARTGNVLGLIGEVMGKSVGVCGGRGGSQHLQEGTYYSNGIQGGIVPVATGMAWAHLLKKTEGIAVVFVGDGTLGEGAVYEALNIAAKIEVPLLVVCENNLFAQSTSQAQTLSGDIEARAEAFGIPARRSDTWNWTGLFDDVRDSVETVRSTGRPLFHRIDTFRLMAHSKGDDNRPSEYVEEYRKKDPLNLLILEHGDTSRWQDMEREVSRKVAEAVAQAESADFATTDARGHARNSGKLEWIHAVFAEERVVESVRRGLAEGLRAHPELLLFGEDVESPYGGAFRCTAALSDAFPGRVRNMPISEAAIVGVGNGLALSGLRPVVEIMFGDFITLATDQWLNHAAKFRFMYNEKVRVPLVVRTPMGGKRGYAATHSQSIERLFLGVPDTRVLCLNHRYSPAALYRTLFAVNDRPTLVVENKILYGAVCSSTPPAGYELAVAKDEPFPLVRLRPRGVAPDVTILAVSAMGLDAERALATLFESDEIVGELFLPTQLFPFDLRPLEESLIQTRRLLVVEEGQAFASFGSEVGAQLAERYAELSVRFRRVAAEPVPIPAARPLEERCLPGEAEIVEAVREIMNG